LAQKELKKRRGLDSVVLYDTHNFDQKPWRIDFFNADLPQKLAIGQNDIVVLQATRVVRRKAIELAIDFIHTLNQPEFANQLAAKTLYHGRTFDPQKDSIYLVLAGYAEKRDLDYAAKLEKRAAKLGVKIIHADQYIRANRAVGREKYYTLWDIYPFADLITYPSTFEGFGNQFLEGIFAQKPIIVFEYPVYKSDIAAKGFSVISLGDKITSEKDNLVQVSQESLEIAVQKAVDLLTNKEKYQQMVKSNFAIGRKNFSYRNTLAVLTKLLA